jgi:hypothetical protein
VMTDDERVDEAGAESFPASDAPSWTSGVDARAVPTPPPAVRAQAPAVHRDPPTSERRLPPWLVARVASHLARGGGLRAARGLLRQVDLRPDDDVVELAPGMDATVRPRGGTAVRVVDPDAMPLADQSVSVILGEATLSMRTPAARDGIVTEAARVLRPGGRYAILELALAPSGEQGLLAATVQRELSRIVQGPVRLASRAGWITLLEGAGFQVDSVTTEPLRLLEPGGWLRDAGLTGLLQLCRSFLRDLDPLEQVQAVKAAFGNVVPHLASIAIVARRMPEWALVETQIMELGGGPWVTGLCSNCCAPVDVRLTGAPATLTATCPNGHRVRVRELHSAGEQSSQAL